MTVIILGAGGFAIELAALVRASGGTVVGFIAPEGANLPAPWLGGDEVLESAAPSADVLVAVGEPATRARLSEMARTRGRRLPIFLSPQAFIADDSVLEEGTMVYPNATVHGRVRLGRGVLVNSNASVGHETHIGDFSNVSPGVSLGGRCYIGERVYLGIGCSMLEGLTIVPDVVIGAGAVVVHSLTEPGTYIGVPARKA